ncbi:MAG: hypothetical protein IJB73_09515 [Firmicutes bacterium]|nr:hypothetical protein [Bacillota bacterium]
MPSFEEFFEYVKKNIKSYMPEEYMDCELETTKRIKENDLHLEGFSLHRKSEGIHGAPLFYVEPYYSEYLQHRDIEKTMRSIAEDYVQHEKMVNMIPHLNPFDYESVKDHITYEVVNARFNTEYLKTVVHETEADLAKVYQILFLGEQGAMGMRISEELFSRWNISKDELASVANDNMQRRMPAVFISAVDKALQKMDFPPEARDALKLAPEKDLYILTTEAPIEGAAAVFYPGMMDMIHDYIGQDFYIVPVSKHEVFITSKNNIDAQRYGEELRKNNNRFRRTDEILSDCIYAYSKETGHIEVVPESMPKIVKMRGLER